MAIDPRHIEVERPFGNLADLCGDLPEWTDDTARDDQRHRDADQQSDQADAAKSHCLLPEEGADVIDIDASTDDPLPIGDAHHVGHLAPRAGIRRRLPHVVVKPTTVTTNHANHVLEYKAAIGPLEL